MDASSLAENSLSEDSTSGVSMEQVNVLIQKIEELTTKLDTVININQDLIKTNLMLSGKFGNHNSDSDRDDTGNENRVKNLFYHNNGTNIIIHGNGTFDKRVEIKGIGGIWNKDTKAWEVYSDLNLVKSTFPGIKSKAV